jgi:hypothetical protein
MQLGRGKHGLGSPNPTRALIWNFWERGKWVRIEMMRRWGKKIVIRVTNFGPKNLLWLMRRLGRLKMDGEWRRLWNSPVDCNEYHELELLGAWEPLDSSRPLPLGKEEETWFGFPNGNQTSLQ